MDVEKLMGTDEKDKNKVNRIMSLIILHCYSSISLQKGRDVFMNLS